MRTFYQKPEAEILRWAAAEAITTELEVSGDMGAEPDDGDEWLDFSNTFKTY